MSDDHGREPNLIRTKMCRPQLPPAPVVRARLLDRLDEASSGRITLISAPAGYGKTTLAVQWLERCPRKVAWILLDPADNDPERFLRYLVGSMRAVLPDCLPRSAALFDAASRPPWSYLSETLVSELGELHEGVVLVFDDFHAIVSDPVRELVRDLVEYLPQTLRLLLLSRTDPHLPLGRWRSKGWFAEIRQRDLRFEDEEVRAFFADASSTGLGDAELTTLREKTEGWIAALQFAKISILRAEDPRESVERFSGSDRLVVDFLAEEVIAAQPRDVRDMLAATSSLERFCGPLCERLLPDGAGRASAADLLAHLARENLFLVPMDSERLWFRYHHLFRQLLTRHLPEAASREFRRDIARRAAQWYAEEGLVKEALQHWVEAGELDSAANYLGSRLHAILDEDCALSSVRQLLALFPPGAERGRLPLLVAHGYVAATSFDLPRLSSILEEADVAHGDDLDSGGFETGDFGADLDALQAFLYTWRGQPKKAVMHGERALKQLSDADLGRARPVASIYRGAGLHLAGHHEECVSFLWEAIHREDARGGKWSGALRNPLAHLLLMANDLSSARVVALQAEAALEAHQTDQYFSGETYYLLGALALERDDLDQAADRFQRVVDLRYLFFARTYQDALIGLVLLAERRGDSVALERWTRETRRWAIEIRNENCLQAVESLERGLAVRSGSALPTVPAPAPVHDILNVWLEVPSITHAEILVTHPDAKVRRGALPYIEEAIGAMESICNARQAHRLSVLRAVALAEAGRRREALDALDWAVTAAGEQGAIRPFLGGGERTVALLEELASRRGRGGFLGQVLRAHRRSAAPGALPGLKVPMTRSGTSSPFDLTVRELETLELAAKRLSNKEIAAHLNLTPGAVNKRLLEVYAKLGVRGRLAAVLEAVNRGFLEKPPV